MSTNEFQVELTARDYQRVGAGVAAVVREDWRAVADEMKDATAERRGFHYQVAVLSTLARSMGLYGPDAEQVLADLQQQILTLAAMAATDEGDAAAGRDDD